MKQEDNRNDLDNSFFETITNMIKDMKYGSVTIIVQDGKVIQVDKTEKHRIKNT